MIVNGQKVDTPGAPKRFRGQQTYIPKMVSLESQIGARARNLLRFFSHQGDRAFIAILLVSPRGVEQASREMSAVEDEAANLAWGRGLLNPQGDDDEVEVVSGAVALRDPLSMAKIATPVRGKLCQHFACFDLQTYLDYNAQHDSWECPVCRAALAPSQVQVCREFQKVLEASQEDDDFAPMLPRADEGSPVGPDKSDDAVQKNGPADTLNGTGLWEDLPKARELYLNPDLALQNLEDSMVGRRRRKRADRGGALCRKSDANDMGESEDSDARSRRHHGGASRAQCISGDMSVSEDSHDELERTLRRRRLIIENSSDSEAGERGAAGKQAVDASEDRRTTIMYSSGSD